MRVVALILAGGAGTRLGVLSESRAKPAVPFAGKFRIIDFALSNCVNSGIYDIGVLTQYLPRSLNDHIGIGRPWDLDRSRGGVRLLQPYQGRKRSQWYEGTADAVLQNLQYLRDSKADTVLILSGDHIYKMDFRPMLEMHAERKADLTLAAMNVPLEETNRFGILITDKDDRVVQFVEKPKEPPSTLANMGVYVFNAATLVGQLEGPGRETQGPGLRQTHHPGDGRRRARSLRLSVRRLLGRRRHGGRLLADQHGTGVAGMRPGSL